MTSAQVVETSVNVISNSPSQDYTHPDNRTLLNYEILYYSQDQATFVVNYIHFRLCPLNALQRLLRGL